MHLYSATATVVVQSWSLFTVLFCVIFCATKVSCSFVPPPTRQILATLLIVHKSLRNISTAHCNKAPCSASTVTSTDQHHNIWQLDTHQDVKFQDMSPTLHGNPTHVLITYVMHCQCCQYTRTGGEDKSLQWFNKQQNLKTGVTRSINQSISINQQSTKDWRSMGHWPMSAVQGDGVIGQYQSVRCHLFHW